MDLFGKQLGQKTYSQTYVFYKGENMDELLKMVGAALISSGIMLTLIGALAAMTWGRITDQVKAIRERETECREHVRGCLDELFDTSKDHGERIAKIEGKNE